jgi:hypothetical protein
MQIYGEPGFCIKLITDEKRTRHFRQGSSLFPRGAITILIVLQAHCVEWQWSVPVPNSLKNPGLQLKEFINHTFSGCREAPSFRLSL